MRWRLSDLSKAISEFTAVRDGEVDIALSSSLEDLHRFFEGTAWQDIRKVLILQMLALRDRIDTTARHEDIIHIQGEIFRCKWMLDMPTVLESLIVAERFDDGKAR
jgi:hypothetical protein